MGVDQPGPGGRARRADRRSRQGRRRGAPGAQIHSGDCRAGWSEEEKQAYRLADNELAARGSWDPDLLRSELRDLKFSGFDFDLIGLCGQLLLELSTHRPIFFRFSRILAACGSERSDDRGEVHLGQRARYREALAPFGRA